MSRWNETITLLTPVAPYQDSAGVWHEGGRESREVFCNPMTIGSMTMAHMRSADIRTTGGESSLDVGLRTEAMVQVRSLDYLGEDRVIYHEEEMELVAKTTSGENTTLMLARRLGNGASGD